MSLFGSFSQPGFWLVFSLLGAVILLIARRFAPSNWRPWLAPLYWLLVPYLALLMGAVSPRLMGLYWFDWRATLEVGAGLLLAIGALAVIAWLFAAPRAHVSSNGRASRLGSVLLAGAEEWYWCFVRAALWEIALGLPGLAAPPIYWSVWGGALLVLPLTLLVQPTGLLRLIKVVILVVTSVLFLYTRNFWLCWLVHAALVLLFTPLAANDRRTVAV
jgi:hypothetical protein